MPPLAALLETPDMGNTPMQSMWTMGAATGLSLGMS